MKVILFFMMMSASVCFGQDVSKYRKNWLHSNKDKQLCENMLDELQDTKSTTGKAYLGAYQMVMAQHLFSPISKLRSFNKGRENLDNSIKSDGNNAESRMLRFVIQLNAPRFLGYYKNIAEDRSYLQKNVDQLDKLGLKEEFEKLLK